MPIYDNPIPFSYFADLVNTIGNIPPRPPASKGPPLQLAYLEKWLQHLHKQYVTLLEGTVKLFFRLFFVDESVRRRYDMQEEKLSLALENVYGLPRGTLSTWHASTHSGCLGKELKQLLQRKHWRPRDVGQAMTFGRVDELLDELATASPWSAAEVHERVMLRRRPTNAILTDLLSPLEATEAVVMVQIILRDLDPVLYPPASYSSETSLLQYNAAAYHRISVVDAMSLWHPQMPSLYRTVADLDYISDLTEKALHAGVQLCPISPVIGKPIEVPKALRPGACSKACKDLRGVVAVETKYDGERLQIHIDLDQPFDQQIRIFSKSRRESTNERRQLLPIVRAALGLPIYCGLSPRHSDLSERVIKLPCRPSPPTKLILEGEMVSYNEEAHCIEEFWKLVYAKAGWSQSADEDLRESHETGRTHSSDGNAPVHEPSPFASLHLKIVWFDILLDGDRSLLGTPYEKRRSRLAEVISPILGYSMLAEATRINFGDMHSALHKLRRHYAEVIANRGEGLMLKPVKARYNDRREGMRWVKLKKDFIPGAGDTLDFHVLGASWQKSRGRELLVPPSIYTTFFVGLQAEQMRADTGRSNKPHFHILFTTSYGLNRQQLADLCCQIKAQRPVDFDPKLPSTFNQLNGARRSDGSSYQVFDSACCSFTFSLASHLVGASTRPSVIFPRPRVFELTGAGFQKMPGSRLYDLRFPRITKVNRTDGDPLTLEQLQEVARSAVQLVESQGAVTRDLISQLMGATHESSRQAGTAGGKDGTEWIRRLEAADVGTEGNRIVTSSSPAIRARALKPLEHAVNAPPLRPTLQLATPSTKLQAKIPILDLTDSPPLSTPATETCQPLCTPSASTGRPPGAELVPPHPVRAPVIPVRLESDAAPSSSPTKKICRRNTSQYSKSSPKRRRRHPAALGNTLSATWSSLSLASIEGQPLPSFRYSWSLLGAADNVVSRTPRHPHLDLTNKFQDPLDVLWMAGWLPVGRREPYAGQLRQGFIFVTNGETDVDWLKKQRGTAASAIGRTATVTVVDRSALQLRGEWDLANEALSLL